MYMLTKLHQAVNDLIAACNSRYPDGAAHAAHAISYAVHRLHNTRPPDHEFHRKEWQVKGEPILRACCRALARLHCLREHVGLSTMRYDTGFILALLQQVIRYLDHLMGQSDTDGSPVPASPEPTPGDGSAAAPCSCGRAAESHT